jgi:hypothetical protein
LCKLYKEHLLEVDYIKVREKVKQKLSSLLPAFFGSIKKPKELFFGESSVWGIS